MSKHHRKQRPITTETLGKEPKVDLVFVILATMEAYRLKTQYNGLPDCPDYDIRVCQSILAEACGIINRNEWTGKIQAEGLFNYKGDAKQQYNTLIERIRKECI